MVCPVCVVAVGAGVGMLETLGVDQLISGLWIGALIVSSIAWMINWLNKKNIHFLFRKILVIVVFYAIFIGFLWWGGYIGKVGNTLLGIDKLLLGIILGSFIFILAVFSDSYMKKLNEGKALFAYQKVFIPLIYLILCSVAAFFVLKIITGV